MQSDLYDLLTHAPVIAETDDSFTVRVSARDALMTLPQPTNVSRRADLITDHPVTVILSKSEQMPEQIAQVIARSKGSAMLSGRHFYLAGLCLNGRSLPVELYLHSGRMKTQEDGAINFDQIFWHEYTHGTEGISLTSGIVTRDVPWSYRLQRIMLRMDNMYGGRAEPLFADHPVLQAHAAYMREGLDVQQNVSELFARVAEIMLCDIRSTGMVPTSRQAAELLLFRMFDSKHDGQTRRDEVVRDFIVGFCGYGAAAQLLAAKAFPQMVRRAAKLYGCDLR